MAKIIEQKEADRVPKTKLEKILTHKINVPYFHDVPGFSGILIHSGDSNADTRGCIHNDDVNMMKGGEQ